MNKKVTVLLFMLFTFAVKAQQKVIQLYNGAAPGSESWTWDQQESANNMYHANTIYNVSHPTLTVYLPDSSIANAGAALIICPGGGFQSLSIMQEGYQVAEWCHKHGITAFLLKYRLMHTLGDDPYKEMLAKQGTKKLIEEQAVVEPMAVADGRAAIAYVRDHASEYNISPSRVGVVGFSAGGTIAASTAYNYTPADRPDFVGAIYAYFPPEMQKNVPADAPPMFLAAASDDQLSAHAVSLYTTWTSSKHQAELHIYIKGGHGFGMKKQNLPSDTWADSFAEWMSYNGFLKPLSDVKHRE